MVFKSTIPPLFIFKRSALFLNYLEWFEDTYGLKPFHRYNGVSNISKMLHLRSEIKLNKLIDENSWSPVTISFIENMDVLTFDEYKEMING